jgi:hypothetical protein
MEQTITLTILTRKRCFLPAVMAFCREERYYVKTDVAKLQDHSPLIFFFLSIKGPFQLCDVVEKAQAVVILSSAPLKRVWNYWQRLFLVFLLGNLRDPKMPVIWRHS